MARKPKITKLTAVVEFQIDNRFISDRDDVLKEMLGQFVKVKSGIYQNIAIGDIVDIKLS